MPIISFNISDSLKKFLKKMVGQDGYKNNSTIMRDALVRLMQEKGDAGTEGALQAEKIVTAPIIVPTLTSSVLITMKDNNPRLEKKLNHLESEYYTSIVNKSIFSYQNFKSITYVLEDTIDAIQMFITQLNSIEELQSFRYILNEVEQEKEE